MTQHFSKTILASVFIAALCAFAPAPKVKSVTFKIFQKGKEVAIEDHKCSLKKAPFEIVFETDKLGILTTPVLPLMMMDCVGVPPMLTPMIKLPLVV